MPALEGQQPWPSTIGKGDIVCLCPGCDTPLRWWGRSFTCAGDSACVSRNVFSANRLALALAYQFRNCHSARRYRNEGFACFCSTCSGRADYEWLNIRNFKHDQEWWVVACQDVKCKSHEFLTYHTTREYALASALQCELDQLK